MTKDFFSFGQRFFFRWGAGALAAAVFGALLSLPSLVAAGQAPDVVIEKKAPTILTKEVVWNVEKQVVQFAKQRCSEWGGRELEECFADSMQILGAPSEAVAFTRSFGSGAYVRRFRETGRVDIAYVAYPFRTTGANGILLVNGDPPIVDVDDLALLPRESMEQDRVYAAIKTAYPRVTMWPGTRFQQQSPVVDALPDGGQGFVVPYALRNFCQSCELLGTVFFSFDFNKGGKLTGIRFLRIELPPKKPPKSEVRKESEQIRFVVMAEEGKEFTVRLNANRTTGYQWRPTAVPDERIVKFVRCEYAPFEGALPGSGGEEIWTFLAVGKGDTEITLEYVRPWEKVHSPVQTATIKVSVRAPSPR